MDAEVFWKLLGEACRMGKFVAAVANAGASANIVGRLELGRDAGERVLQKKNRPKSHVHFRPEVIEEFAFTFVSPGTGGPQPCIELRTGEGVPVLRLYYQGGSPVRRHLKFMGECEEHAAHVTGSWSPQEAQAVNEGIFVGSVETAGADNAAAATRPHEGDTAQSAEGGAARSSQETDATLIA